MSVCVLLNNDPEEPCFCVKVHLSLGKLLLGLLRCLNKLMKKIIRVVCNVIASDWIERLPQTLPNVDNLHHQWTMIILKRECCEQWKLLFNCPWNFQTELIKYYTQFWPKNWKCSCFLKCHKKRWNLDVCVQCPVKREVVAVDGKIVAMIKMKLEVNL